MKTVIQLYDNLREKVKFFHKSLKLKSQEKNKGRKLAITPIDSITLGLFKQQNSIQTKKSLFNIFKPTASTKLLLQT